MSAPTLDDLVQWIGLASAPTAAVEQALAEALNAARTSIEGRCNIPDEYPDDLRTAVLIGAARIFSRRKSPEGVAGFGEAGVIRFMSTDVDVESLIRSYLKLDGFV